MFTENELSVYMEESPLKEALNIPKEEKIALTVLGQGEYNLNYTFLHPVTKEKLVLRINTGSQMHLDNQIEYEYKALKMLEGSGRTPKVYFVDNSKEQLPYGVLVMEFLEGRPLIYEKDMKYAAECLADIHSVPVPRDCHLISPQNPFEAIVAECKEMSAVYLNWEQADEEVKTRIRRLTEKAEKIVPKETVKGTHIINTELNSGNFLIGGEGKGNYLIDWEKPLLGEAEQDLGHFLAPTTTFWKTDTILSAKEMEEFLCIYEKAVDGRFDTKGMRERFSIYLILTCLRGITWCAMAYVEYMNPDRALRNEFTFGKIKDYLKIEFLDYIEKEYYSDID